MNTLLGNAKLARRHDLRNAVRENKTKVTNSSVASYIAAISDPSRRADCEALSRLMAQATKQTPKMWGTSIVGFGARKYALAGGRTGEICSIGFSSRKADISVYGVAGENANQDILQKLGKYTQSKGCLYIARLADVDVSVLKQLCADASHRNTLA